MATKDVPNWKFWHPLSFWKALGIMAVVQIVFQIGLALLFVALQRSGGDGGFLGAGIGGGLGVIIIHKLAEKAKAAATSDSEDA